MIKKKKQNKLNMLQIGGNFFNMKKRLFFKPALTAYVLMKDCFSQRSRTRQKFNSSLLFTLYWGFNQEN